jgi:hypothetical protein
VRTFVEDQDTDYIDLTTLQILAFDLTFGRTV